MTKKKETYRCWFLINPNKKDRPFTTDEQAAADTFVSFLADKDYGRGISLFRFDIYVEQKINLGHHQDTIYTGCAHLTANIDYSTFLKANQPKRHKLLLNGALNLCKYLSEKVPLPKDFDAKRLATDYTNFLTEKSLLLSGKETSDTIIKIFDTTKFNFRITKTAEVKDKDIHYDLVKVQDYINNKLSGKTFGASVRQFDFGYEIYDFKGNMKQWAQTADLKKYGTKYKNLLVVKQFDYQKLKGKTHYKQFEILKQNILEAINDTDKLTRKPKHFDKAEFYKTIEKILNDYQARYCQ
ncbi:MAG: hypothetical protein QM726_15840 [Chitinophagaceae bacterium]